MIEFVHLYISPALEETRGYPAHESRTGGGSTSSSNAGFSQSIHVQSDFPRTSRKNAFGHCWHTLYGPVYGAARGLRWQSVRMNTWMEDERSLGT